MTTRPIGRPSTLVERLRRESRRPASLGEVPSDSISLAIGEPFEDTPHAVVDAAVEALRRGRTRYAPMSGTNELRQAVASHLISTCSRAVSSTEVVLTHGASAGLAATILAVVNPGDRVVVPEPTYSLYADHVTMTGGEVAWVPHRPDGSLDLDAIGRELPGAALVVVCNPSNPTGRVMPPAELEALSALAAKNEVLLLCDEAYCDIVFEGAPFKSSLQLPEFPENVICCRTFSKSYSMTGWRLGFVVAHSDMADRIGRVHRAFNGALSTFVQDAACRSLALPPEHLRALAAAYQARRDLVTDALRGVPFLDVATPQGAFYAFPKVRSTKTSEALTRELGERGRVVVRSGTEFGPSGEGYLRLSYAMDSATLEEGLDRFLTTLGGIVG